MKERIVCVEWEDAAYSNNYYDKDKPENFSPVSTRSVGHLIKSSKKYVIISMERFYDSKGRATEERHINIIPKKMIKKITELR